jgi:methylated-DNA-[protein]-cysteine S-methyltransferase
VSISFAFTIDHFAQRLRDEWGSEIVRDRGLFPDTMDGLRSYLNGDHTPIHAIVQPVMINQFTQKVHTILSRIPYGKVHTYRDIAIALGKQDYTRAVGVACHKNQTLIVVPCHRVVAVRGLGGFGAGLATKRRLLEHEGVNIGGSQR